MTTLLRRERAVWALCWLLLATTYGLTISTSWRSVDIASAEVASWQIAHTGAPWLDNPEGGRRTADGTASAGEWSELGLFWTYNEHNGRAVVRRTPGVIAAGVPAYWIQARLAPDSASTPSAVPGGLTAALLAATTVLLVLLSVRDLVPRRALVAVGLTLALATPYWSLLADALWTHGVTTLGIAGMAWGARRERWWLVGLFGGIGLWGRLHVALIVALLGLGVALWRRRPAIAVQVGIPSVALLTLTFVWGHWMYGAWGLNAATGGYGGVDRLGERSTLGIANVLGYLVSPGPGSSSGRRCCSS
ncbi:hypothetical protein [Nocardioides humi]|uniref:hypothetical protein n=1 Tax=Nocardioides humi TaxID=449461 RepID=UPI001127F29B|nr:hypothetical protein [Nocardioides humi]